MKLREWFFIAGLAVFLTSVLALIIFSNQRRLDDRQDFVVKCVAAGVPDFVCTEIARKRS